MARQLVRHGHIQVNGAKVDVPSYRVSDSDIVEVRQSSLELTPFVVARAEAGERDRARVAGGHPLTACASSFTRCRFGSRSTLSLQEQLIVELYSK